MRKHKAFDKYTVVRFTASSLPQLKQELKGQLRLSVPIGIREICANTLWQMEYCEEISVYNMDEKVYRTLHSHEMRLFQELCELAIQLKTKNLCKNVAFSEI